MGGLQVPSSSDSDPDNFKILEIKTMGKERDTEAKDLLTRAAKQVQPVMRRRGWKVGVMMEFYPKNDNLLGLNVNRGQQVKVRLRPAGRLREFYPFDFVLGTLLHELVHNEFGPHDQKFYKLLDTITEECEDDMSKGISGSGTGFDAKSAGKVGGRLRHHNPPEADLRRVMLDAAQKRAQSNAIMTSGGRKLGGDKHAMRSLTPAEAAARAAERRFKDDQWCGETVVGAGDSDDDVVEVVRTAAAGASKGAAAVQAKVTPRSQIRLGGCGCCQGGECAGGERAARGATAVEAKLSARATAGGVPGVSSVSTAFASGSTSRQAEATASIYSAALTTTIDLTLSDDDERSWPQQPPAKRSKEGSARAAADAAPWACERCTLLNDVASTRCAACDTAHSTVAGATAAGTIAGWVCRQCSTKNTKLQSNCELCKTWRYSYGPPLASRPTVANGET